MMTKRGIQSGRPLPNPSPVHAAIQKAREWFREPELVTAPEKVAWTPPRAAVLVGKLVAIEYLSDKFDGVERVYRHELDEMRDLAISPDGTTMIILPGLKITTRGIEG